MSGLRSTKVGIASTAITFHRFVESVGPKVTRIMAPSRFAFTGSACRAIWFPMP
jgi:hypothetical protein